MGKEFECNRCFREVNKHRNIFSYIQLAKGTKWNEIDIVFWKRKDLPSDDAKATSESFARSGLLMSETPVVVCLRMGSHSSRTEEGLAVTNWEEA